MIWTVIQINVRRLLHNRVELLLTFVVPIVFFSIFALIFGGGIGSGTTPKIKVVAVDEVNFLAFGPAGIQLVQSRQEGRQVPARLIHRHPTAGEQVRANKASGW